MFETDILTSILYTLLVTGAKQNKPFVVTQEDIIEEEYTPDFSSLYIDKLNEDMTSNNKTTESDLPLGITVKNYGRQKSWYFDDKQRYKVTTMKQLDLYFIIKSLNGNLSHSDIWKKMNEKHSIKDQNTYCKLRTMLLLKPITTCQKTTIDSMLKLNITDQTTVRKCNNTEIHWKSLKCLSDGRWLNDEVINYFFSLLKNHSVLENNNKHHFVSTFFYKKLTMENKYNYNNVQRWINKWTNRSIFSFSTIYVPINIESVHWALIIVDVDHNTITYYDSLPAADGLHHVENIIQLLTDHAKITKERKKNWRVSPATNHIPKQENTYDCGIFTCMYAYFNYFGLPMSFTQSNATEFRIQLQRCILSGHSL